MPSSKSTIRINRAPVLTLWAAVVAERLGFKWDEAMTLGKAVAGLNAQSKGRRLGIFKPAPKAVREARKKAHREEFHVVLLGRHVPAQNTEDGIRAAGKGKPISAESVERYLAGKFGDDLNRTRIAMEKLAAAYRPSTLADEAYELYEEFRPSIPSGTKGWGAKGDLDLNLIRRLAGKRP